MGSNSGTFTSLLGTVLGPDIPDNLVPASADEKPAHELTPYDEVLRRAQRLLNALIIRLELDAPAVVSYRSAYRLLSGDAGAVPRDWSVACARWLVEIATGTEPVVVRLLGRVKLDGFLVSAETRQPTADHWMRVGYDAQAWQSIFCDGELWPDDEIARRRDS